jgi:hypothetical protein
MEYQCDTTYLALAETFLVRTQITGFKKYYCPHGQYKSITKRKVEKRRALKALEVERSQN